MPQTVVRVAGVAATVLFAAASVVWLLTFVPLTVPDALSGLGFVAFFLMFPLWGITIIEASARSGGRSPIRTGASIPLVGWRRKAGAVIWLPPVVTVASFAVVPWSSGGAEATRFFTSGFLVFSGMAALLLTQPEPAAEAVEPAPEPPGPTTVVGRWTRRISGSGAVAVDARGGPPEVVAVMQQVIPLGYFGNLNAGRVPVHADWDQKAWPSNDFPFRIDGHVTRRLGGWSTVELSIQAATRRARHTVVGSFFMAAVFLGISVAFFLGAGQVGLLFGAFLLVMAAMQVAIGLAPARASRRVRADLVAVLSR